MTSRWRDCAVSFQSLPRWVRAWVLAVLIPVNAAPFFLLDTPSGRAAALASLIVVAGNVPIMLRERGMSRLMAVPHFIAWVPLIVYLIEMRSHAPFGTLSEAVLAWVLIVINMISLGFDGFDLVRWWRGERAIPGQNLPSHSLGAHTR